MARKDNWYSSLPIVLLGLRMSPNSLDYSPFTAVTGAHMLCPHPIICSDKDVPTSNETIQTFVKEMQSINFYDFSSGDCHSVPNSYIPSDLHTAPQVWLRVDRVRKSLEAPYSGPFEVLRRYPKYFVLRLPQGDTSVSIDRLKPVTLPRTSQNNRPKLPPPVQSPIAEDLNNESSLLDTEAPISSPSPTKTRSGRTVKFKANPDYRYF